MKEFDFIKEMINKTKDEIKARKNWKNQLIHEYGLQRTFKENRQEHIIKLIRTAEIMINHYEKILEEQKAMYDELIKYNEKDN